MSKRHIGLFTPLLLLWLLATASPALAGPPTHLHNAALDIGGFNHACGVAVDSEGDVYVASAGESKVKVFDPAHTELTSIANANEPCGLAVNSKGELYVSEKATGKVVRYKPNAYPFSGAPTYGSAEPIDSSGDAKGIAVDPHDDRLYVAEGDHIAVYKADGSFEVDVGGGDLTGATGVAVYTYLVSVAKTPGGVLVEEKADRYIFAADAATDQVKAFSGAVLTSSGGTTFTSPKLRKAIDGPKPGEDFGFGTSGAYLAVDPGNRSADDKCTSIAEQACTAGHLLVYDEAHEVVDEFDASGEFLDQFTNAALTDAAPTALAIDRSGGLNDGTIYISAGSGPGSELLAFGPLAAPSRAPVPELSHVLKTAQAVATDFRGNVYVVAGSFVHVYGPDGVELTKFEDPENASDLAVDSTGKVYVLDLKKGFAGEPVATYYTPSAYPPVSGTSYVRNEPPVVTGADFSGESIRAITVNPSNDHLLVTSAGKIVELDSAAPGHNSAVLNPTFGAALGFPSNNQTIGVHGASGNVYISGNGRPIAVVNAAGTEVLARINGAGSPKGKFNPNQLVAVDQSNGHVLEFQPADGAAREYDAAGAFVAEFGSFTSGGGYRIAVDNSCALHDPPLTETTSPMCKEFDPANGNVYVAYDDPAPGTFDVTAFGPLAYGEAPLAATGVASGLGTGDATLNGTVNPNAFDLTECRFEYIGDDAYQENIEEEDPAFEGGLSTPCAESIASIGKGTDPVAVHADISGLDPEERQRFRLVARNKYGESEGEAVLFGPPVITTRTALPILYTEATLRARIDPSGLGTKYRFEYGKAEGVYDHATATKELSSGALPTDVQAPLTGLDEGTTYHFRVVAENEAGTVEGPDQTLVTSRRRATEACPNTEFRTGLSANLPDCRAYELVTPAETNGLSPYAAGTGSAGAGFNNWLVAPRGADAGESLAYFTDGTLPGFEGSGVLDGYRARRGAGDHPVDGWSSQIFGPSYVESGPGLLDHALQRGVASDQLYSFWRILPAETFEGTLPEGVYLRTPSGFEVAGQGSLGADLSAVSRYVSAGGSHVIFTSKAHLEGEEGNEAPPVGTEAIYDRAAGSSSAKVVSLLPGEVTPGAGQNATYIASTEDGTAVAFKVGGALYLRRGDETVQVAAVPNAFAGVSEDGRRVFYTATADGSTPGDLFACDVESGSCAGPEAAQGPTQIAEDSIFVNVSADGSGVLFTTEEASEDNLYAWDGETEASSFVAVLDPEDLENKAFGDFVDLRTWTTAIGSAARGISPARSTPDGEVFVFQSHAQLTSYDNEGVGEIYRYDPAAAPAEQLLCVSCDPSGASASADAMLEELSGETPLHATTLIPNVTDDGRQVYFQSVDRLLPEDANDVNDVYQWRAKGSGGCDRASGCLALISSGQGERPSYLYSMSADGHDVFFRTREKLVGPDVPGSPSLYDARVEGGIPDPPAKAPCQGDACQGNGSIPPVIQSPASTTIRSSGNTGGGEGRPRCRKGQRKVRRAGKTRCVKKQQRKSHRKRSQHRTNHNGRAHR